MLGSPRRLELPSQITEAACCGHAMHDLLSCRSGTSLVESSQGPNFIHSILQAQ